MACNNCTETQDPNCGCTSEALHINQICNPVVCPVDECAESFSAACIRYTGADLVCDNVTVVETDTNMAQAIANIMAFVCANDVVDTALTCGNTTVVPANSTVEEALGLMFQYFCSQFITTDTIECQESSPGSESIIVVPVVPSGTTFTEALELIVEYFCDRFTELDFPIDDLVAGAGITVTSNTVGNLTTYTITNSSPASSVTLTNVGGTETLVNDGTGPALATKGLSAGTGIALASTSTAVTISNTAPDQVVGLTAGSDINITGTYPNFTISHTGVKKFEDIYVSAPGTLAIPHNLNLSGFGCVMSIISAGGLPPYSTFIHGVDYTYIITNNNIITITDLVGMGNIRVTVIGS